MYGSVLVWTTGISFTKKKRDVEQTKAHEISFSILNFINYIQHDVKLQKGEEELL